MAVRLYMDIHLPMAITRHLRLRGVDVVTATEEDTNELKDDLLLDLPESKAARSSNTTSASKHWPKTGSDRTNPLPVSSTAMPKAHLSANTCATWNSSAKRRLEERSGGMPASTVSKVSFDPFRFSLLRGRFIPLLAIFVFHIRKWLAHDMCALGEPFKPKKPLSRSDRQVQRIVAPLGTGHKDPNFVLIVIPNRLMT